MILGVLIALFSALTSSLREAARKYVSSDFSSIEIGYITQVYGLVLLLPFGLWIYAANGLSLGFWTGLAAFVSGLVVVSSTYIYIEAMRIEDFSLTEPLRQTTPLFVAVLEPVLLGTAFSWIIVVGAALGSIGAYLIVSKNSLLKPIKNILNKGALMSVLVAFIFAIWAIVSRFGATKIHPISFTYLTYISAFVMFWIWKQKEDIHISRSDYLRKDIFMMGSITAVGALSAIYAYSLLTAAEVTIIKQTSGIFGVIIGGSFYREDNIWMKMLGSVIILLAVVLVLI